MSLSNLERWASELQLVQERGRPFERARAAYRKERAHVAAREVELLDLITGRATAEQLPMDLRAKKETPAPERCAETPCAETPCDNEDCQWCHHLTQEQRDRVRVLDEAPPGSRGDR